MRLTPRDYQRLAFDDAASFLRAAPPRSRTLYAAPTGTGKSIPQLLLLNEFPDLYLVTPRVEIIAGLLDKLEVAEHPRLFTPVTLRNRLAEGVLAPPGKLCIDESHHDVAEGIFAEL